MQDKAEYDLKKNHNYHESNKDIKNVSRKSLSNIHGPLVHFPQIASPLLRVTA